MKDFYHENRAFVTGLHFRVTALGTKGFLTKGFPISVRTKGFLITVRTKGFPIPVTGKC